MTMSFRWSLCPALAIALALAAAPAAADVTKAACVAANASGQDLLRDRKLSDARVQLQLCSDPKCPALVRTDCTKRLDELEAAQPTLVFDAKDGLGRDITAVKVSVDGKPLVDHLDGSALAVDPGEHTFTLEADGLPTVTLHLVLKEGEKLRHERASFAPAPPPVPVAPPPPAPAPATPPPVAPSGGGMGTQKALGLTAGVVGAAALVTGGVFGLLTASAISHQKTDCPSASNCPNYSQAASDHSTWTTDGTISTVAFIAGGVLLVGGVTLFFTAHPKDQAATGLVVVPGVGPSSGGMLVRGEF